jgi:hypothetical protein
LLTSLAWFSLAPASSPAITAHLAKDLLANLLRHHRLAGPGTFQAEPKLLSASAGYRAAADQERE